MSHGRTRPCTKLDKYYAGEFARIRSKKLYMKLFRLFSIVVRKKLEQLQGQLANGVRVKALSKITFTQPIRGAYLCDSVSACGANTENGRNERHGEHFGVLLSSTKVTRPLNQLDILVVLCEAHSPEQSPCLREISALRVAVGRLDNRWVNAKLGIGFSFPRALAR